MPSLSQPNPLLDHHLELHRNPTIASDDIIVNLADLSENTSSHITSSSPQPRKDIIIFEPGSLQLRAGFANREDPTFITIPNCIAYYRRINHSQPLSSLPTLGLEIEPIQSNETAQKSISSPRTELSNNEKPKSSPSSIGHQSSPSSISNTLSSMIVAMGHEKYVKKEWHDDEKSPKITNDDQYLDSISCPESLEISQNTSSLKNTISNAKKDDGEVETKKEKESLFNQLTIKKESIRNTSLSDQDDPDLLESSILNLLDSYRGPCKELERASKNATSRYLNERNTFEIFEDDHAIEWANIDLFPPYLVCEKAFGLDDHDPYDIYFPFLAGRFNREHPHMMAHPPNIQTSSFPISNTMAKESISRIFSHVISHHLNIPEYDHPFYDAMLVIPDSFSPQEVKDLVSILLLDLGFGHVLLAKSSPCASLSAGKNGCCVVNVGFGHTTIACVENLDVVEGSCISLPIGGLDVDLFLHHILTYAKDKNYFRYNADITRSIQDLIIFEEIKESTCHLDLQLIKPKTYEFLVRHRQKPTELYRFDVGMSQFLAPFVLLNPGLRINQGLSKEHWEIQYDDPEDMWANTYQPQTISSKKIKKNEKSELVIKTGDGKQFSIHVNTESIDPHHSALIDGEIGIGSNIDLTQKSKSTHHPSSTEPSLAKSIIQSITSTKSNSKTIQHYFSHIVLTGGSASFSGLKELLESEIYQMLPMEGINATVSMVNTCIPPKACVWRGAAVLVSQAGKEFWINKESFKKHGLLALREKLLFSWDNPMNKKMN